MFRLDIYFGIKLAETGSDLHRLVQSCLVSSQKASSRSWVKLSCTCTNSALKLVSMLNEHEEDGGELSQLQRSGNSVNNSSPSLSMCSKGYTWSAFSLWKRADSFLFPSPKGRRESCWRLHNHHLPFCHLFSSPIWLKSHPIVASFKCKVHMQMTLKRIRMDYVLLWLWQSGSFGHTTTPKANTLTLQSQSGRGGEDDLCISKMRHFLCRLQRKNDNNNNNSSSKKSPRGKM